MFELLLLIVTLSVFLYILYDGIVRKSTEQYFPPGPKGWPIVGNLLDLDKEYPQDTLTKWAKRYGKIYRLDFGGQMVVVLNDADVIREALVKQPDNFAGRPSRFVTDLLCKNRRGIIFADGPANKDLRRFSLSVLRDFGFGKSRAADMVRLEAEELVTELEKLMRQNAVLDPRPAIKTSVVNIITQLLFDKKFKFKDPQFEAYQEGISQRVRDTASLAILNFFPWLRFLSPTLNSKLRKLIKAVDENYRFVDEQIHEHEIAMQNGTESNDYTGRFLAEIAKDPSAEYLSGDNLLAACLEIHSAGFETTVSTLMWFILYIAKHPEIQEEMYEELVDGVGDQVGDLPDWSERAAFPFTNAVIMETQRVGSILPLGVFHKNFEETTLSEHKIPAGSIIVTNLHSAMRDEAVFPDPDNFQPHRFLEDSGLPADLIKAQREAVIPYSLGKRACLGESLARMELFMFAAALVLNFRMSFPEGHVVPGSRGQPGVTTSPYDFSVRMEKR